QRAVLGAMRIINCKPRAKVIEAVWRSRVFAARQQERIKHPLTRKEQLAGTLEFGIEKGEIKQRVVRNKRRIADEYNQVLDDFGKERLVFEKLGRQAVDRNGFGRHLALRIEIAMKTLPGRNAIDELDAADFHHPMALKGIESRGLRIEYDFAHGNVSAMMPAADESLAPLRHCSNRLEDRTHLGARRLEAARCIHDEIGPPTLLLIRHLLREDGVEFVDRHARAFERARALYFRWRGYHDHGIDAFLAAGLE